MTGVVRLARALALSLTHFAKFALALTLALILMRTTSLDITTHSHHRVLPQLVLAILRTVTPLHILSPSFPLSISPSSALSLFIAHNFSLVLTLAVNK